MKEEHRPSGISLAVGIGLFVGAVLVVMGYIYWYGPCDQERCGQFGDFLGGVLNPIIGAVTLCALVWTVKAQSETLQLTRAALVLAKSEAKARADESEQAAIDREAALKKSAALETYDSMRQKTEELLSRPTVPWDHGAGTCMASLLEVIDGTIPLTALSWWLQPLEERNHSARLYGEHIAYRVACAVTAAAGARPYMSQILWMAESARLRSLIVFAYQTRLFPLDEAQLLANTIDAGIISPRHGEVESPPQTGGPD